jgi:nitric oxide reductase NorD protein
MSSDAARCRSLRLLATAIVGRPVPLTYLTQEGADSYTDGEEIFLSRCSDLDRSRRELIVQCALLAGKGLGSGPMRAIVGRPELRQRYLLIETLRSCRAIEERLPGPFLRELEPYGTAHSPLTPEESVIIATSHRLLPRPPAWFGTIRPWRILRSRLQGDGSSLTDEKLRQLESNLPAIGKDRKDDEDEDSLTKTSLWKWFVSPLGRDNMLSRLMREVLDLKSSPDKESPDSGASASAELVSGRVSRYVRDVSKAVRSAMSISFGFSDSATSGDSYPEWDCSAKRYRLNWTRVAEVNPGNHLASDILPSGGNRAMQRALAKLSLGFERHRGRAQGDDLALDRMIRLAIDLRSGHSGDERIYSASLKTRRDLGVQILLDVSSSTLERSADGPRIFDLQAQAAWRVCRAFSLLGDRVAMHGFHSWGRSLVRLQTLKSFDEPLGHGLEDRMRRLLVAGYTRCGAAIRHATERLDTAASTPHKLLILISDGFPYDDQYEGDYAAGDTRKAIEEARARGVAVVCLSVGSEADAKRLDEVYGAANYLAVARADELPTRLRRLVENAIADAWRVGRA